MKKAIIFSLFAFSVTLFLLSNSTQVTQKVQPLSKIINQKPARVASRGKLQIPLITWGGDVATIYTHESQLFKQNGLDVDLFVENNFPNQVRACLQGKTPFLRGTMGMITAAAEVFKKQGIDLVVVYQLTWSTGGDALVTRSHIKKPRNLRNSTIALQLYGPHMDYIANILNSAGIPLSKVNYRWFSELTLPTFDTKGKIVDPVSAFLADDRIDGVLCIIPDAMNLTSGGKVGTGSAGSVKNAKIMLSTKTASRIICDVYAVRSDYFKNNNSQVMSLVKSLLEGQEKLANLLAAKKNNLQEYNRLMSRSADLLLGTPQAIPDVEALLGDCKFAGLNGNISFFTGKGSTRTLGRLTQEITNSFLKMNLLSSRIKLINPNWNFDNLSKGIGGTQKKPEITKRQFDARKVVEKISVEPTTWAEKGTLFQIEIGFAPNQSDFSQVQYADDFEKALNIAQTYAGSLIIIEGHSDPLGILKAKQSRKPAVEINQMEQQAKNLSLSRARAVRKSFLNYCSKKGYKIDESQFVAVGIGISSPKYNPPRTKEEWIANRRVVFRIKQVEAELSEFTPL